MSNFNKNKSNWIKELVNIVIGGSLIGLFSLFFLPLIAIKYWWLIWLISSTGILLWRLLLKRKKLARILGLTLTINPSDPHTSYFSIILTLIRKVFKLFQTNNQNRE